MASQQEQSGISMTVEMKEVRITQGGCTDWETHTNTVFS